MLGSVSVCVPLYNIPGIYIMWVQCVSNGVIGTSPCDLTMWHVARVGPMAGWSPCDNSSFHMRCLVCDLVYWIIKGTCSTIIKGHK